MAEANTQVISPTETEDKLVQTMELETIVNTSNVAEDMDEQELNDIASDLVKRIKEDERSMEPWMDRNNEYLKLALQVKETKSWPWMNAANVKYPLLTIAALQFHARAYPTVVNPKAIVKGKVIGYDPTGEKAKRAERIGKHMTYQLLEQIENWDEDMDKLCLILPITGCLFKKNYWDEFEGKIASDLILPTDLIVNYWAKSLEDARRITQKLYMYPNTVIERQRQGLFLDTKLSPPNLRGKTIEEEKNQLRRFHGSDTDDVPYCLYECHTYLDLDNDGYKEPYVVVIEPNDQKILRIAPNYSLIDIKKNGKGEIVRIKPKEQFVQFNFIPSPDGGLLGVGFGLLLGSLNEVVNTSLNQILDQGTMATTSGGFISKGIKLKGGRLSFEPNEWKVVQTTGDDLRKGIVPLPVREPSKVLFEVLQAVVASGKEIIAISEISTGKLPGQNTPATTTISSIEEGMKLFTAIYKRIHRSLKKEFKSVFRLNSVYLQDEEYFTVLDDAQSQQTGVVAKADYQDQDMDVVPESDPNAASDTLRLMKAQQLVELIPLGAVDPAKAGQRILEALDQPNVEELMPQPQQDPKMMQAQMDAQIKQQEAQMDMQMKQQEMQFKKQEAEMKLQVEAMKMKLKEMEMMLDMKAKTFEHQLGMQSTQESHAMNMQVQREKNDMQRETNKVKSENANNKATSK
jgi:chaperonin GroES